MLNRSQFLFWLFLYFFLTFYNLIYYGLFLFFFDFFFTKLYWIIFYLNYILSKINLNLLNNLLLNFILFYICFIILITFWNIEKLIDFRLENILFESALLIFNSERWSFDKHVWLWYELFVLGVNIFRYLEYILFFCVFFLYCELIGLGWRLRRA